jgi:hypothetical protein
LISVLSLGELKSRGEKARRNFRQLERVVRPPSTAMGWSQLAMSRDENIGIDL